MPMHPTRAYPLAVSTDLHALQITAGSGFNPPSFPLAHAGPDQSGVLPGQSTRASWNF